MPEAKHIIFLGIIPPLFQPHAAPLRPTDPLSGSPCGDTSSTEMFPRAVEELESTAERRTFPQDTLPGSRLGTGHERGHDTAEADIRI